MGHVLSLEAIHDQKAALAKSIAEAQSQLADLEVAERIVRRFGHETENLKPNDEGERINPRPRHRTDSPIMNASAGGTLTSRSLMSAVLRQSDSIWMTANEIQERASAIRGSDVPMGTVSPTLSLMKNDGLIVREGLKVALADRLNENGETEASPDTGGGATPSNDEQQQ